MTLHCPNKDCNSQEFKQTTTQRETVHVDENGEEERIEVEKISVDPDSIICGECETPIRN